jgi:hypothetical protein
MVAIRLARLIEEHSDDLSRKLVERLHNSRRAADFRNVPSEELEHAVREVYSHIREWLMTKTESEIERRFKEVGARRFADGISLPALLWALSLTKEQLWEFLGREGWVDRPVELFGELELIHLMDQFYDRAVYYAAEGYEQARTAGAPERKEVPLSRMWL